MNASRSDRFAAFGAATKGALRLAVAALEIVPVVRVVAVVVTSLALFPTRPVQTQTDLSGRPGKGFVSTVAQGDLFMNLGYDARGNLAKEESSQGVSRLVEYDEWDRVVRETSGIVSAGPLDPAPVVVEYGYDAAGRLAFEKRNQTQAAGGGSGIGTQVREVVTRYTYDERGQLLTMTEEGLAGPSGGVSATGTTTFSYQPGTGHLDTVTSPAGVVTKYRYDAAGRLAGERTEAPGVSPSPGESLRGYDILSRVNYQTDGDTAPGKVGEWKGIYDGFSRLVRQTLPTGAILEADYDQADGITEVRAKDAAGVLLSRISGVKLTTTGEVVDLSEHQGTGTPRRVQKTLDAAGRTTHVLNDGRVEREYEFQPATGRLLVEKTPTREQRYTYDGGSLWAKSVAAGEAQTGPSCSAFLPSTTTEIRRDAQGRPVAETKSDGKSTTYLWDEEGRPLLTREGSEAHFLTWDSRGALARLNRPNGRGETTFGYDLDGRPIRQVHTVPGLLAPEVTSAGIDAAGRRASLNLPDGGTELYRYDSDGELSEVTRPDGVKVGIERDRANRITRILPTAAGPTRAVLDGGVEFTYDVLSRLLETKRLPGPGGASGVDVGMPTYDLAGRVLSEVVAGRAPMQRSYDTKGRVLSVTLPSGTQLDRTYQTCSDRLETISGAGLGKRTQDLGAAVIRAASGTSSALQQNVPLIRKNIDFVVIRRSVERIAGRIEAKYRVPDDAVAMKRLVDQLNEAAQLGSRRVLWTLKEPTRADIARLRAAMGEQAFRRTKRLWGVDQLYDYSRRFR